MATTPFATVLADQRAQELLSQQYLLLAADRNALPNHQALVYGGDFFRSGAGMSTAPRKIPILGFMGYDLPDAVAEGASIVPSVIEDRQVTVHVSRRGKAYQPTDEVRFTDGLGVFNSAAFAMDAALSRDLALTSILAGLVGGFTLNQTTTGVNLTATTFLAALGDLEVGSQGQASEANTMTVLHSRQVADLRDSLALSTAGAIQWAADSQPRLKQTGYSGKVFGIDVFSSNYVVNNGTDCLGGMFTTGGIVWCDMGVEADMADQAVIGSKVLFERDRTALAGLTAYVSACWLGASRGYDTAPNQLGVSIVTDAP